MKRAPKEKKASFDVDRFIGGAATVAADTVAADTVAAEPASEVVAEPAPASIAAQAEPTVATVEPKVKAAKPKAAAKTAPKAKAPRVKKAPEPEPEPTAADMIRTSFDLPKSLQKRLKVGAVIKGVPMRDLVEDAIRQYLDRENLPEAP